MKLECLTTMDDSKISRISRSPAFSKYALTVMGEGRLNLICITLKGPEKTHDQQEKFFFVLEFFNNVEALLIDGYEIRGPNILHVKRADEMIRSETKDHAFWENFQQRSIRISSLKEKVPDQDSKPHPSCERTTIQRHSLACTIYLSLAFFLVLLPYLTRMPQSQP